MWLSLSSDVGQRRRANVGRTRGNFTKLVPDFAGPRPIRAKCGQHWPNVAETVPDRLSLADIVRWIEGDDGYLDRLKRDQTAENSRKHADLVSQTRKPETHAWLLFRPMYAVGLGMPWGPAALRKAKFRRTGACAQRSPKPAREMMAVQALQRAHALGEEGRGQVSWPHEPRRNRHHLLGRSRLLRSGTGWADPRQAGRLRTLKWGLGYRCA